MDGSEKVKTLFKQIILLVLFSSSVFANISVNSITADNIINLVESTQTITVSGSADGTTGDDVNLSVNSTLYETTLDSNGNWSVDISGDDLKNDTTIDIVTPSEDDTHTHSVDVVFTSGSISVDSLTSDNVINLDESKNDVNVSGSVSGGDVSQDDVVTIVVGTSSYSTSVDENGDWYKMIAGTSLLQGSDGAKTLSISIASSDDAGNVGTSNGSKSYSVDTLYSASISVNNLTDDNVINKDENDSTVTISGSVSGDDWEEDDNITMSLNGTDYQASLDSNGAWSVDVDGDDLATSEGSRTLTLSLVGEDDVGNASSVSLAKGYSVDRIANVVVSRLVPNLNSDRTFLENGLTLSFDVSSYAKDIAFSINGTDFTTPVNQDKFIAYSDLGLTDGDSYEVTFSQMTDVSGNTVTSTNFAFKYDLTGNNAADARTLTLGEDSSQNIHTANSDEDWFEVELPSKGTLEINSTNAKVKLISIDAKYNQTKEWNSDSTSLSVKNLGRGTYYILAYGDAGDYTLSTTFSALDSFESDEKSYAHIEPQGDTNKYASYFYVDAGNLYIDTDNSTYEKFIVKNGNQFRLDGANILIQNYLNNQARSISLTQTALSLTTIDNILYVVLSDNTLVSYDISDLDNISLLNSYTLSTTVGNIQKIQFFKQGSELYLYTVENNQKIAIYQLVDSSFVLKHYIDAHSSVSDIWVEKGVLYSVGSGYIRMYNLVQNPLYPSFLTKTSGDFTQIVVYDGIAYVNNNGGSITKYEARFDFSDVSMTSYYYDRVELNSSMQMNKYAGKEDTEIFAIDLEYSGEFNVSVSGADMQDLNLTLYADASLSTKVGDTVNLLNDDFSHDLNATTYYVKIQSGDINASDDYTLINTFVKDDEYKDNLLNISLMQEDDLVQSSGTVPSAGIFQFSIDEVSDVVVGADAGIYSADFDDNSAFVQWNSVTSPLEAGTYYIKSTASESYTISAIAHTTEHLQGIKVLNTTSLQEHYRADTRDITLTLKNSIVDVSVKDENLIFLNDENTTIKFFNYEKLESRYYVSKTSNGKYVYALALYMNPITLKTELSLDVIEMINSSTMHRVKTVPLDLDVDVEGYYKVEYRSDEIIIATPNTVVRVDPTTFRVETNSIVSLTNGTKKMLIDENDKVYILGNLSLYSVALTDIMTTSYTQETPSRYVDIAVQGSTLYAITSSQIDVVKNQTITDSKTLDGNLTTIAVSENLLYVSTDERRGVIVLDKTLETNIKTLQKFLVDTSVVEMENKGENLYIVKSYSDKEELVKMTLQRDFSDTRENASALVFDENISGSLNVLGDEDWFKVEVPTKGYLELNITDVNATLYSQVEELQDTNTTLKMLLNEGTYFIKLSSTTTSSYSMTTAFSKLFTTNSIEIDENVIPLLLNEQQVADKTSIVGIDATIDSLPFIKNGNKFIATGTNVLEIQNSTTGSTLNEIQISAGNILATDFIENTLYILNDLNQLYLYDISDIYDTKLLTTYSVISGAKDLTLYQHAEGVFVYLKVSINGKNDLYVYKIQNTTITQESSYDAIDTQALDVDLGMLYVVGSDGISMFNVQDSPSPLKLLSRDTSKTNYTNIYAYGGKIYLNALGGTFYEYNASFDTTDVALSTDSYSRVKVDSTIEINKYSNKADTDIYAIDLEYDGELNITASDLGLSDLTLTLYDDVALTSQVGNSYDLVQGNFSQVLSAKTYFIKITTQDIQTADYYMLDLSLAKEDDAKDKLFNISLTQSDDIVDDNATLNAKGYYQFTLDTQSIVEVDNGAKIYSAVVNNSNIYASMQEEGTLLNAGRYYVKVDTTPTTFQLSTSDTDEYKTSLSIVQDNELPILSETYIANDLYNTQAQPSQQLILHNTILGKDILDFNVLNTMSKEYLTQVQDGSSIYALYKHTDGVTQTTTIGLDRIYYQSPNVYNIEATSSLIEESNATMVYANKYIFVQTSTGLLKVDPITLNIVQTNTAILNTSLVFVYQEKLYIATDVSLFEVDTNDITQAKEMFNNNYVDMIVDNDTLYAISTTTLDIVKLDGTTSKSLDISGTLVHIALSDNILYVATQTNYIQAIDITTLKTIKTIATTLNITGLQNIGNQLFILSENAGQKNLYEVQLQRDFSNDIASAYFVNTDETLTGQISSLTDKDFFKIELDFSGELVVDTQMECKLYEQNTSLFSTNCTQTLSAGTYYIELSNSSLSNYEMKLAFNKIASDQQDTLRFFDEPLSDDGHYRGKIDVAGDVDYFKVYVPSHGELELNATGVEVKLTYDNGVELPKDSDGNYLIVNGGTYFLQVTGNTVVEYDVMATFTAIDEANYFDKSNAPKKVISDVVLNGSNSLVLTQGNYAYRVDDVDGLLIFDYTDAKDPQLVSKLNLTGSAEQLFLDGTTLYIALGDGGVSLVDISNANTPFLYQTFSIGSKVTSVVATARELYVGYKDGIKVFSLENPRAVQEQNFYSYTGVVDLQLSKNFLYIAMQNSLVIKDLDGVLEEQTISLSNISHIVEDTNYIVVAYDTTKIVFINKATNEQVFYTLVATTSTTQVLDLYLNEKILYVTRNDVYESVEYKDISNITSMKYDKQVESIGIASDVVILSKAQAIEANEVAPDYVDTITNQYINIVSLDTTNELRGQFSRVEDVDSFAFTNVNYTGSFELNVTAPFDINITLLKADGTVLSSGVNAIDTVLNAEDFYLQIQSVDSQKQFSYLVEYAFENDGELDVLKNDLVYEEVMLNSDINGSLYFGGGDKDLYKLNISERGTLALTNNFDKATKLTILYASATVIATNEIDGNVTTTPVTVDLSAGEYYILIESNENSTAQEEYSFQTVFTPTTDAVSENGVSVQKVDNIESIRYSGRYIFLLNSTKIIRYSNLMEPLNEFVLSELEGVVDEKELTLFTYNYAAKNDTIVNYVGYMNYVTRENSTIFKIKYDIAKNIFVREIFNADMSGLSDERIMFIDKDEYIYYYDEDSIYIAPISDTSAPQQVSEPALQEVYVQDNVMYVVASDYIKLWDLSNKNDVDDTKLLGTINEANVKAIFVDKEANRLFASANNKIQIYNISDKTAPTLLNEIDVAFESGDMFYQGTPSSLYIDGEQLIASVQNVGLLIYNVDSFHNLELRSYVLNLGESVDDVYTLDQAAINYTLKDINGSKELKVYFYENTLLDADSVSTLYATQNGVNEGCFIATAAYGSYFEPYVKTLRDFRDNFLLTFALGREFVEFYYTYSPPIAKVIAEDEALKTVVRIFLTPIVYFIKYPILFLVLFFAMFAMRELKITKISNTRKAL